MKKLNILSIVILVCVLLVVVMVFLLFFSKNDLAEIKKTAQKTEAQIIKEANSDAINKAKNVVVKNVRSISEDEYILGDINAPVQLIEYSDFECPYCARFSETVKKAKEEFGEKLAIVFRYFPLRSHKQAIPAALSAECAGEQGKFWEMHDLLFSDAKNNKLNNGQFKENAKKLDLDQVQFNKCLDTEQYKDKITAGQIEGKNAGVSGTPGSFVNGEVVPGAVPYDDFVDSSGRERGGLRSIILRHLSK